MTFSHKKVLQRDVTQGYKVLSHRIDEEKQKVFIGIREPSLFEGVKPDVPRETMCYECKVLDLEGAKWACMCVCHDRSSAPGS